MLTLSLERTFSSEGVAPLDFCKWKETTAVIKNDKGEALFEQKGLQFPEAFSQTAINIVASKYFYGDNAKGNGSPKDGKREHTYFQLCHRVAHTIAAHGIAQKFFTEEGGSVYYDELMWLLLNQYGAFNSPVWFNVGLNHVYGINDKGEKSIWGWGDEEAPAHWTEEGFVPKAFVKGIHKVDPYERPQGSACFIISAEDSIEDIWEMMAESARLFKYGSGIGADWSSLRSTRDVLSGGGQPSGPVSFMRVQDSTASTIKSGGRSRRAAVMQTLKVWHPDILEFVRAKQTEEKKAWALIEMGYDGSFNGDAYGSVGFQNVNQTVRVTDQFMEIASHNTSVSEAYDVSPEEYKEMARPFDLLSPATGEALSQVDPRELLMEIAEGTHICGDPGLQFEDQIQKWHTCKNSGPINSSNPCSEFMFLDDTACNLASLNLRKFVGEDGVFDVMRYRAAINTFLIGQEIMVDLAGYPSEKVAKNSHRYRPLGLGFANLGALLMSKGLPYDSKEGRNVAAALMAIMHCEAYTCSAKMAAIVGPFEGFAQNAEPMMKVIRLHQNSITTLKGSPESDHLREAARESGATMVEYGNEHGFRNSQVTVLAPTGTIGFLMDCDTTGIEPEIGLVKYKLLAGAGDGYMKLVNTTVDAALCQLGYSEDERVAIVSYIDTKDTIEGCMLLKTDDLPVFDCAFKPHNGTRAILPEGHLEMMAAVQPFISGAISKTVNLPESASVGDIYHTYEAAWMLGLKAVAVYRENSKRSQPLNMASASTREEGQELKAKEKTIDHMVEQYQAVKPVSEAPTPKRQRLPDERESLTHKFSIAGHEGYLHVGLYPDDGQPGEIFITMAKQGSTISGLMDTVATLTSIGLQYGVPLEVITRKLSHTIFEPSGFTQNPDIPMAKSVIDYLFRYLHDRFISPGSRARTFTQNETPVFVGMDWPSSEKSHVETLQDRKAYATAEETGPACPNCGSMTVRAGSCHACPNCGTTTGCG